MDSSGLDVTKLYLKRRLPYFRHCTANTSLTYVVFKKENSPSCGSQKIYNGTFQGEKLLGVQITTALFAALHSVFEVDSKAMR